MTTYLITRHSGAIQWAQEEGILIDEQHEHLDPRCIHAGDIVIGTLPINLAAQVCEKGGRYIHLSLLVPPELRGKELSAAQMRAHHANLDEFHIQKLTTNPKQGSS